MVVGTEGTMVGFGRVLFQSRSNAQQIQIQRHNNKNSNRLSIKSQYVADILQRKTDSNTTTKSKVRRERTLTQGTPAILDTERVPKASSVSVTHAPKIASAIPTHARTVPRNQVLVSMHLELTGQQCPNLMQCSMYSAPHKTRYIASVVLT